MTTQVVADMKNVPNGLELVKAGISGQRMRGNDHGRIVVTG